MSLSETVYQPPRRQKTPPPGPFGFMFTEPLVPPLDTPYEPAPAPPPGPALLDDSESNMLDSFFTSMNSNQMDNNDFWFTFGDPMNGDTSFTFEWPDLPPTFEGSTTSLPSQPLDTSHTLSSPSDKDRGVSLAQEMMAAGLYQNGNDIPPSLSNQLYTEHGLEEVNRSVGHGQGNVNGSGHPDQQQHHQHPHHQHAGHLTKGVPFLPRGVHTNKMIFDPGAQMTEENSLGKFGYLSWGSDAGFLDQGYRAPPEQQSEEERTTYLLHHMRCLERQNSAAPTRSSSPHHRKSSNPNQVEPLSSIPAHTLQPSPAIVDGNSRPTKRQKGNNNNRTKEEDEAGAGADFVNGIFAGNQLSTPSVIKEDHDVAGNNTALRQQQRSRTSNPAAAAAAAAAAAKPQRENLTEEQKRTNHILSEQKRRNLIKDGFRDLCEIVPQLQGGGYSKSTMLIQAANWLEDLLRGNELLKAQLADLKSQQQGT